MKYVWRGPFKVVHDGPYNWKIVNRYGDVERLGFRTFTAATAQCEMMNSAQVTCDPELEREDEHH